ncbi:MAG: hypothetical protein CMR00_05730 [[Chlorobium] sp. 445]|nr:MAG: hypothetical protein CMR00_05730 [[Chlorobium] sp. 445]
MKVSTIPDHILDLPISGINLRANTLREELGNDPTLLVFVRHFGCIFCREMIADIAHAAETVPNYPSTLFFYQGTLEDGHEFFPRLWRKARAIADLPKTFYNAFGLERGSLLQMFGPEVWACGVRAAAKGHFIGLPVGDPWTMPGLFYVQANQILWQHDFKHAGDHPDFEHLPAQLATVQRTTSAMLVS